jgi:ubiquitin C-terminal hydrolase
MFGTGGGDCALETCLAQFSEEERLTGNDEYYCSKCKKHQVPS